VFVTPPEIARVEPAEPEVTERTNRPCGTALGSAALHTEETLRCCLFFSNETGITGTFTQHPQIDMLIIKDSVILYY
jgi:hypothetical protein